LSEFVNPYHAGRPVKEPAMFFGRDDALIWTEQQLTLGRRLLLIHGPDLIGKTSVLYRLSAFLPETVHCLFFECKPQRGRPLPQVLAALARDLVNQLMDQNLISPHQVDTAADSATAVKSLLQQAVDALESKASTDEGYRLLLVLDDIHRVLDEEAFSTEGFFEFFADLLAQLPSLQVLLTLSDETYTRLKHPLLLSGAGFRLGPISTDAAQQLIMRPAQGTLRFDAGVTKRISEITSNHPYYLHLFCYTLYNDCARDGWINQSDVDRVLETLLTLPNEQFQALWHQSNWAEQAALAGLAAIKGAHGLITRQEVVNYLQRFEPEVVAPVILDALESLADQGVLVRMGALSYRFAVNLYRYWVERQTDPAQILAGVDWNRVRTQRAARSAAQEMEAVETQRSNDEKEAEEGEKTTSRWGQLSILGLTGTAFIGIVLLALAFTGLFPAGNVDPTPTIALLQVAEGFTSPVPSATPSPVPTVTPTRPLVVAHSLPAIVYMARGVTANTPPSTWQLFVMNADGSNRQRPTESNADDITPVWSPDGQRIAFTSQRDGNREIYLVDANGAGLVNLTQHPAEDWTPAWLPDGDQIAFSSNRQGNWEIFIINADGTNLRQVTNDGTGNLSPVWSPDGKKLVYCSKRDGNWEIYAMDAPGPEGQTGGEQQRLTFSEGNDLSPLFSPTGDRIAFESNREGNVEIFVMSADGANQRNLSNLSYADDHGPVWSPDGRQLLFYSNREGNWDLYAMSATGENVVNLTKTPDVDEQAPAWRP
jgi:hypothetical protein